MRSIRRSSLFALVGLSLVAGACRDEDPKNPTVDAPGPGGDMSNPAMTIKDIQNDALPAGSPVSVSNVIVTAIDTYGARTGDIYLQDQDGGAFSGIKVFGVPTDQVALLAVGDVVTLIGGEKDEFALDTDTSGRTVTEIKPISGGMMTVTKTGTGTIPTPATVDAKAISELPVAMQDAEWEKWEGVLITVTNARQAGDVSSFGMADDQKEFDITGGAAVQTVLAAFPDPAPAAQTCYQGITGIGDYFFNYLLLPRSAADLVTGGTGCSVAQTATIAGLQMGTTPLGPVTLEDVYVTAIAFNKKNFWIGSSMTAAPNEGIAVFRGSSAMVLPNDVVVGAKVTISGTAVEANNDANGDTVTQITGPSITVVEAPVTTTVTPVTNQMAATLNVAATGEPYESVMVTLTNVKVVSVGTMANFYVGEATQNGVTFKTDDDIYRMLPADVNQCWASVTGIWTYQIFDNTFAFLPLAAGTGTGTCL